MQQLMEMLGWAPPPPNCCTAPVQACRRQPRRRATHCPSRSQSLKHFSGHCRCAAHAHRQTALCSTVCSGDAHDQTATPLLDAVHKTASRLREVPLHVPGHKRGAGAHKQLQQLLGDSALRHDLTELPGLDYLSSPSGPIADAQRMAAAAFGADHTWFLVNGTTCGIHAAVMAACGPGDTLVVARNCHLSAVSAMVLSGCRPQWVQPRFVAGWDMAQHVTPAELEAAFAAAAAAAGRPAKAALVVSPTYFGVTSNIPGLAAVCHRHNALLLVDEAHGAHCGFDNRFPPAALAGSGPGGSDHADIVVQSTHKMLSALTQAAMLHVRGARALQLGDRITSALQVLQSSSPSYLLMASLDAARAAAAAPGAFDEAIAAATAARAAAEATPGLQVLVAESGSSSSSSSDDALPALDPLKLTIDVGGLGITGYQAADWLAERHGIAMELATSSVVLAAFGAGSTAQHADRLGTALAALSREHGGEAWGRRPDCRVAVGPPAVPSMKMVPRHAHFAAHERVAWDAAVSRVSAELLCPYPPGIPAVVPGEVLTEAALSHMKDILSSGGVVTGAADPDLCTIGVVCTGELERRHWTLARV